MVWMRLNPIEENEQIATRNNTLSVKDENVIA